VEYLNFKRKKRERISLITEEERAVGSVSMKVYKDYFKSTGSILYLIITMLLIIIT
jgi:hypothetical protein